MNLLIIAPASTLAANIEITRIASGHTIEIVDGLIDRAGLERSLRNCIYDAVHFIGHGGKSVLELSDGLIDKGDVVTMLSGQCVTKFVLINACDSVSLGVAIHNALHVPVIATDDEFNDKAAVRFAETFYRAYRRNGHVGGAFDTARETLQRLYPPAANVPVLINGDMASTAVIGEVMTYVRTEIGSMNLKLDAIGVTVDELKDKQSRVLLVLLILLLVAQLLTPWLNHAFGA